MLPWFTSSDIKPLSLVHIREQGRLEGIEVPGSLDLRDPDAKAWEAKWAPTKPWVRALRGYRRVNALLKKLQTLKAMLRPDGYASFQMKYFGAAATGRWSGSGGFNIQNLPKAPAVLCKSCWGCDFDEDAEKKTDANTLVCPLCKSTDVETIDMRGLLMASPGKTLIISDYAQIEARMLLWQVNDRATLDLVAKGMSVYEAHARATMGWTGGNLKKENPKLYFLAKCRVLGCGYGIGKGKFQALAALWGFDMSLEDAGIAVAEYRQSNPLVTNRWRAHQLWLKVSINHTDPTHEVPLANGRTIKYFAPHVDAESKPDWPEFAAHTVKGEARQLRRLYGGKLTENETQANARNKMGDGIEAVEKAGIPVLFHAHDEAIGEVAKDQVKDAVREMEYALVSSSEWAKGCPLAVETQTSDRYTK
jgi:DNA polymerase